MHMSTRVDSRRSRSLIYGLTLLRQFTADEPVRGIAELAEALNVSRPTAHRYASTCLELGYLEQAPMRRYRLSPRATEPGLAMVESLALVRRARPIMRELRHVTGRTVSLAILDGADVLYLLRLCGFACGQYALEQGLGAGSRRRAGCTAAGTAILISSGEETHRPQSIDDGGLVILDGGLRGGARGLAVAVEAPSERSSAIELTVPAASLSASEAAAMLGKPLRTAATALQATLARDCENQCVAS
jgi:DNA-binding IclR family transcriptional regulator